MEWECAWRRRARFGHGWALPCSTRRTREPAPCYRTATLGTTGRPLLWPTACPLSSTSMPSQVHSALLLLACQCHSSCWPGARGANSLSQSHYSPASSANYLNRSPTTLRPTLSLAVLRAGEIVESGNHDELVAAGGEYSRLASLQITHGQGRDLIRVEADEVSEAEVGTWVGDATVDARLNAPARLSPPSAHHAHRRRRSLHLPSSWPAKPCGRPCWGACTGPQQLCSRCKGVEGRALKAVFVGPTGSSQHPTGQPSTPYHCPHLYLRTVPSAACCVSSVVTGRPCSSRCLVQRGRGRRSPYTLCAWRPLLAPSTCPCPS